MYLRISLVNVIQVWLAYINIKVDSWKIFCGIKHSGALSITFHSKK